MHRRYGESVAPFVTETFRHVGREGLDLLKRLRRAALDYVKRRPGGGKPVGLNLRRLRLRIEAAVLREVADTALLAMGCRSSLAMGWGAARHAATAREARSGLGEQANVADGSSLQQRAVGVHSVLSMVKYRELVKNLPTLIYIVSCMSRGTCPLCA